MNFKDDLGFQAFQEKVLKWKEIFVQGINHPHDLGEARAEALTWEDIIFKGKLDAVDFCFLSDKAMAEAGSFDDRAKYFLHKIPYYEEVTGLIPQMNFIGDYAGAEMPNGDKIGFLPQWFENGEIIVRSYIRLAEGFELDCDSLILFENCNCIGIVRYVKDFPPEYYQKKEAYETRKANAERDDDDLPF